MFQRSDTEEWFFSWSRSTPTSGTRSTRCAAATRPSATRASRSSRRSRFSPTARAATKVAPFSSLHFCNSISCQKSIHFLILRCIFLLSAQQKITGWLENTTPKPNLIVLVSIIIQYCPVRELKADKASEIFREKCVLGTLLWNFTLISHYKWYWSPYFF